MGRKPGSKNVRKKPETPQTKRMVRDSRPKKTCVACEKVVALSNFYKSYNLELHKDGYLPYCKQCLIDLCLDPVTFDVDIFKVQDVLRQCDRPWDETLFQAAIRECERDYSSDLSTKEKSVIILQTMWRGVQSLPQYRMSWQEYEDKKKFHEALALAEEEKQNSYQAEPKKKSKSSKSKKEKEDPIYFDEEDDAVEFVVTRDILQKFGQGYTRSEYKAMVDKFDFLSQSYPELTNLHTEALCTYVRYKVKEEFATAEGNIDEAEKWAALATKQADKARINPSQLSQSDLQGGLNSFSELMMAIEQAVDIIPILPQFKFRPMDAVDFTIWCYVNYIRKAEGKPLCDYEDIYKFYDERKAEYIAQYGDPTGIFKDDPTEGNRANVKKFITLPKDYGDDNA